MNMKNTIILGVLLLFSIVSIADGTNDLINFFGYSLQYIGEELEKKQARENQAQLDEWRRTNHINSGCYEVNSYTGKLEEKSGECDIDGDGDSEYTNLGCVDCKLRQREYRRKQQEKLEQERREVTKKEQKKKEELDRLAFIDLGLPSGTLWRNGNEGGDQALYTHDEALAKFADRLPTKEQCEELMNLCTWTLNGNGCKVVGPNGNSIFLPAAGKKVMSGGHVLGFGFSGVYWSVECNCDLWFVLYSNQYIYSKDVSIERCNPGDHFSVRLVLD